MENDIIVNIDLSTIESILSDIFDNVEFQTSKIDDIFNLFQDFMIFNLVALGFISGLLIGYFFVRVMFDGD